MPYTISDAVKTCHQVATLHAITRSLVGTRVSVVPLTCRSVGVDPSADLQTDDIEGMLIRYASAIAEDIGVDQSREISTGLAKTLLRFPVPTSYGELFARVEGAYRPLGRAWAPLLTAFVVAVARQCTRHGATDLVFLARDGLLIDVVYRSVPAARRTGVADWVLDLNRQMSGLGGSNESTRVAEWELKEHVYRALPAQGRLALVDTGLYGTLVNRLAELGLFGDGLVMFFASRNPDIYGYLQSLHSSGCAVEELATLCCDTLESWPKPYSTAWLSNDEGRTVTMAEAADPISICAHLALAQSLSDACARCDPDAVDPLAELDKLRRLRAAGVPVLLSRPVATWSDSGKFLNNVWNAGQLPPLAKSVQRVHL